MTRVTALTKYKAFRWLWRFDPEAGGFWLWRFVCGSNLQRCVEENLRDFGV